MNISGIMIVLALTGACLGADWRDEFRPQTESWRSVAQELVIHNEAEPEILDPARSKGVLEGRIESALFEGLVLLHPRTLEPVPGVASHWEVSEDHLTYTFHLRPEARWSDGNPVTAMDFVASWRRVLDPATASSYAAVIDMVVGAEALRSGKGGEPAIVARDAQTLVVTLREPCPWFLELCAFHTLLPVRIDSIEKFGTQWNQPGKLISNGPFVLSEWLPRERLVVKRSATYWDRDFVKLVSITFLPYEDLETAYKLFRTGQIHWLAAVPPAKLDEVLDLPEFYAAPYFGTYFYRLNVTKPPLDDVRVRRAISLAIDRRQITRHITRAGERPSGALCPPGTWYQPVAGPAFDIAAARAALAEAGYGPGGKTLPTVELLYNSRALHRLIAETVAQQLRQALGIDVVTRNSEWKSYIAAMNRLEFDMVRSAWIGDYGDPDTFFTCFLSGNGNNRTGWANPTYDDLVRRSQTAATLVQRQELLSQAEDLLVNQECPIVCLFHYVAQGLLADTVHGWASNVRDLREWRTVWLEQ